MSLETLTPKIAAALAADVYETLNMPAGAAFTPITDELKNVFDFSSHGGAIHGRSGGLLFRRQSGFAVVGKGKAAPYKNAVAIAFRGTQTSFDWLSNSNTRTVTVENQTQAHKGFYDIFNSMRPALEQQLNPLLHGNGRAIVHCSGHITTILRQSGVASVAILGVQNLAGGVHTFYDNLAMELEKSAKVFPNDEHVKGLLAHMLVFAGRGAHVVIKLTARFIRWVFEQVLAVLSRAVRYAVSGLN